MFDFWEKNPLVIHTLDAECWLPVEIDAIFRFFRALSHRENAYAALFRLKSLRHKAAPKCLRRRALTHTLAQAFLHAVS
jgi:hypothetical protein